MPRTVRRSWPLVTPSAIARCTASSGDTTCCSAAPTMTCPRASTSPRSCASDRYSGSPAWQSGLSKQIINSPKGGAQRDGTHSDRRPSRSAEPKSSTSCPSGSGSATATGRRTTRRSRCPATMARTGRSRPAPSARRRRRTSRVAGSCPGNENFQMGAFMKGKDNYLYSFGTPSGRGGAAFLSRVPPRFVADPPNTRTGTAIRTPGSRVTRGKATPIFPGPVGEMSAQYNDYLKQYLVLYTDGGSNDVVARTAPSPKGPWSPEQMLRQFMADARRHLRADDPPLVIG